MKIGDALEFSRTLLRFLMSDIVGAEAQRYVAPFPMAGMLRLEYGGYDCRGIAVVAEQVREILLEGRVAPRTHMGA